MLWASWDIRPKDFAELYIPLVTAEHRSLGLLTAILTRAKGHQNPVLNNRNKNAPKAGRAVKDRQPGSHLTGSQWTFHTSPQLQAGAVLKTTDALMASLPFCPVALTPVLMSLYIFYCLSTLAFVFVNFKKRISLFFYVHLCVPSVLNVPSPGGWQRGSKQASLIPWNWSYKWLWAAGCGFMGSSLRTENALNLLRAVSPNLNWAFNLRF